MNLYIDETKIAELTGAIECAKTAKESVLLWNGLTVELEKAEEILNYLNNLAFVEEVIHMIKNPEKDLGIFPVEFKGQVVNCICLIEDEIKKPMFIAVTPELFSDIKPI